MGSVVIAGSTSGTVTITPPAEAGTRTLTLPAATGTAILENASGVLQMNSGYGSNAAAYGCRAWVNFNGSGTVAIRDSGNVSSITDHAVGQFTVNFTTAMPDVNYTSVGMGGAAFNAMMVISQPQTTYVPTTTSCRYVVMYANAGYYYDPVFAGISIFR